MIQLEVLSPSTSPSVKLLSLSSSVPIGSSGLVHIVGRNDTSIPQYVGIHWVVREPPTVEYPDGRVIEDYEDWTGWAPFYKKIDPDDDHEFIGGRFDINKEGTYTIAVGLFMNIEAPVMVASYEGDLCSTVELPPECTTDADCPEGYVCVNGVCVPEEEVEKKFPWTPVIIGAGAVVAIAGLAAAAKKR